MTSLFVKRASLLRSLALSSFYICALIGISSPSFAAVTVPGSVSPGQVQKRFEEEPTAPSIPNLQLPAPHEQELSQEMRDQLAKKKFALKSVIVEGSTVYSADDLKPTYVDLLGQTISLLDAHEIAGKITKLYHDNGYVLSQAVVPPQDVTSGVLKIRVVEGYVDHIVIQGDVTDREKATIEGYVEHIKDSRPVRTQDLERYLLLLNDLSGANANGLLRPSAEESGAADLVLTMGRKRFDGSYVFDNRGSKYIGPWQHTGALAANSVVMPYDRTQLRMFTTSPNSDQLFGVEFMHQENLDSEGTVLTLLASHTHSAPGDVLAPLQLQGDSNLGEAKVTHPFVRSRQQNLIGRVAFDYRDTITDIFNNVPFTSDRLRIGRIGGTYNMFDGLRGNNLFDGQMSQGMNIFGASSRGSDRSNVNGDSTFTKFNGDFSRVQPLPKKFSLLTAATGQYSFQPLLADEQFSLGGPDWARAFDPAELLGDRGVAGKTELRYTDSPGLSYFDTYQVYGFYDIGHVWVLQGAPGANNNTTLSSAGVGTRLTFTENLSGNFEAAIPLVKGTVDQTSYRHDPRIFMSLVGRF